MQNKQRYTLLVNDENSNVAYMPITRQKPVTNLPISSSTNIE